MQVHRIMGDKVRLYRRIDGGAWHASTYLAGKERRKTTKQKSLSAAKEVAEDWYLELRNKNKHGELTSGKTFREAAKTFEREYEVITNGRRSPKWVQGHKDRLRLHLLPFLGSKPLKDITSGVGQEYRVHRMTKPKGWDEAQRAQAPETPRVWKHPARNTIHNEIVTLSMVLKTAQRHGWIDFIPDLSDPYRRQSKVEHRP